MPTYREFRQIQLDWCALSNDINPKVHRIRTEKRPRPFSELPQLANDPIREPRDLSFLGAYDEAFSRRPLNLNGELLSDRAWIKPDQGVMKRCESRRFIDRNGHIATITTTGIERLALFRASQTRDGN